jgi:hypothetical protein
VEGVKRKVHKTFKELLNNSQKQIKSLHIYKKARSHSKILLNISAHTESTYVKKRKGENYLSPETVPLKSKVVHNRVVAITKGKKVCSSALRK